jgi:DNA-binding MarR family transcriptional regulator
VGNVPPRLWDMKVDLVEPLWIRATRLLKDLDSTLNVLAEKPQTTEPPNNRRKLSGREVTDLRRLARTTGMSQRELAGVFDINPATVSRIVRGHYHK